MNSEETLVYGSETVYRRGVVGWAVLVAVGVGMVWGLASVFTGWRLAWLAPLVALAIGRAWRDAPWEPTRGTAVWAAALMILSAGLAWGTAALVGRQHITTAELEDDPGLVLNAVRDWMYHRNEIVDLLSETTFDSAGVATEAKLEAFDAAAPAPPQGDLADAINQGPGEPLSAPPMRPEKQVRQRLADMTDAQKQDVVAWYIQQPGGQATRRTASERVWRWSDWIWVAAGAWLAFRRSSGAGVATEDDDAEPDPRDAN